MTINTILIRCHSLIYNSTSYRRNEYHYQSPIGAPVDIFVGIVSARYSNGRAFARFSGHQQAMQVSTYTAMRAHATSVFHVDFLSGRAGHDAIDAAMQQHTLTGRRRCHLGRFFTSGGQATMSTESRVTWPLSHFTMTTHFSQNSLIYGLFGRLLSAKGFDISTRASQI